MTISEQKELEIAALAQMGGILNQTKMEAIDDLQKVSEQDLAEVDQKELTRTLMKQGIQSQVLLATLGEILVNIAIELKEQGQGEESRIVQPGH